MAETKTERKVAVILATDVVGYSGMMEENEERRPTHRKNEFRRTRGRTRKCGSVPRLSVGYVVAFDGPRRSCGLPEAAGRTVGGFGRFCEDRRKDGA